MKAVVNQEPTYWSSEQESHLVPGHQFESEVNRSVFPILIDEIGRNSNKRVPITFRSPDIMDERELSWIDL